MHAPDTPPEAPRCDLYVLAPASAVESARRLVRAAAAFGIPADAVAVTGRDALVGAIAQLSQTAQAIAIHSELMPTNAGDSFGAAVPGSRTFANCLIYGPGCPDLLASNRASPVSRHITPKRYRFPAEATSWVGPFAGLDFPSQNPDAAVPVFSGTPPAGSTVLMTADDQPVLIALHRHEGPCCLWATRDIADVGAPLPDEQSLRGRYPELLPLLIFLKSSFGPACWHAPRPYARLIIDDPLLRPSYGYLRYSDLLESMSRSSYGATIAFIPWNHRRTNRRLARVLAQRSPLFSLCVHGRDHTNREFASIGEEEAMRRGSSALERMRQHEQTYGLACDPVMVFPQGLFSIPSLRGLQRCGFSAAVNSTCLPASGPADALTVEDLIAPAVTRYHGFPVFPRRYPASLIDFAFDLYVGKAALIVEHHDYLRDGYTKLESFISRLHAMEPALHWADLETVVTSSCRQRFRGSTGEVLFYTRKFHWSNPTDRRLHLRLRQYQPGARVERVRVNGTASAFRHEDDWVCLEVDVDSHEALDIRVECNEAPRAVASGDAIGYRLSVTARRALSEVRDNLLSRNPTLLNLAKWMAGAVKMTGKM